MDEKEFTEMMTREGISEDALIEKLIDEGWTMGGPLPPRRGDSIWENYYWPPEKKTGVASL